MISKYKLNLVSQIINSPSKGNLYYNENGKPDINFKSISNDFIDRLSKHTATLLKN